jgi:hypothetical protein
VTQYEMAHSQVLETAPGGEGEWRYEVVESESNGRSDPQCAARCLLCVPSASLALFSSEWSKTRRNPPTGAPPPPTTLQNVEREGSAEVDLKVRDKEGRKVQKGREGRKTTQSLSRIASKPPAMSGKAVDDTHGGRSAGCAR